MKRVGYALALLALAGVLGSTSVLAAKFYQWKDAAGITHFTDNPSNIPKTARATPRNVGALGVVHTESENQTLQANGKKLWNAQCVSCHFEGQGRKGKLRGLGKFTVNQATHFPATSNEMLAKFRPAVEGRTTDMKRMTISDEDLLAIARYLLAAQK